MAVDGMAMLEAEDRNLLEQLRRGSKEALRQIYARYKQDLFTVAVLLLGAFPEGYRYSRRLFSLQGPRQRARYLVPVHLRHLTGR